MTDKKMESQLFFIVSSSTCMNCCFFPANKISIIDNSHQKPCMILKNVTSPQNFNTRKKSYVLTVHYPLRVLINDA